jgi:hypothetical protein
MTHYRRLTITTLVLLLSSLLAAAGTASAATTAHPVATHAGPAGTVHAFIPGGVIKRPAGALAKARGIKNQADSTNWSGYVLTGANGAYNEVSAEWGVPGVDCPGGDQYEASWVGLDGYNSGTVEQIGTSSDCDGTTPVYNAWYEMYPAAPVYFSTPGPVAGLMFGWVTFSGTDTYTLTLQAINEDWTESVTVNESGLDRSSAEVITEAPSSGGVILPLADFPQALYRDSYANDSYLGGQDPTPVVMVNSSGEPLDSTSGITAIGGFHNRWIMSS